MSSVFNSAFVNTRVPASLARNTAVGPSMLRSVATWLGLAPAAKARVAPPVQRRSWEQHKQAMLAAGDKMLARSRSDNQPLSIAVFDLNDLPELESVFGAVIAREVMAQVVLKLQGMASSRGVVIRTDATVFTVLMPGFGRDLAHRAIERAMGSPCCIELDADEHEIVLVPDFKVHTMRPDSAPLAEVYAKLQHDISAAQQLERRRQRYLQLERESHTRPMDLLAQVERKPTPARHPVFRPMDPTMPMPIKA